MKAVINGIEREIQVVPVPKGGFCITEGLYFPWFPLFCAFSEAITEEEKQIGDVMICPISGDYGYGNIEVEQIKNEVLPNDIHICLKNYMENYECEIDEALNDIIDYFEKHGYSIEKWKIEKAKADYKNT